MKVLFIGFPKTGTTSMHVALEKLGYKVYDYEHNFYHLGKQWLKILSGQGGTKEDFYEMYKDVDASVDMPAGVFWKEILEAFPDVKLVFNDHKTEEEWWISWKSTVDNADGNKLMVLLAFLSPTAYALGKFSRQVVRATMAAPPQWFWQIGRGISPVIAKKCYRNHNANVRLYKESASTEQFLTFHPSEGWEPLCKFLKKPIPNEPFPHKNQGGSITKDLLAESPIFWRMKYEMIFSLALLVVIAAVLLFKYPA